MIEHTVAAVPLLSSDLSSGAIFGASGLVAAALFVKWARRMFYTEKKDTAVDLASTEVYEILSKENKRMADQMEKMSIQLEQMAYKLQVISTENHKLTMTVSELTISVQSLANLETENIALTKEVIEKDTKILCLTGELAAILGECVIKHQNGTFSERRRSTDHPDSAGGKI